MRLSSTLKPQRAVADDDTEQEEHLHTTLFFRCFILKHNAHCPILGGAKYRQNRTRRAAITPPSQVELLRKVDGVQWTISAGRSSEIWATVTPLSFFAWRGHCPVIIFDRLGLVVYGSIVRTAKYVSRCLAP